MIKKILHFLARLLLLLLLTALVLGGILLYNLQMNKSFITTFYTVTVDKPVEDLRIVLLSDLHLSEYGTDNADLVRKVRNLAPDLIAVAGDMDIDTDPDYSLVLSLMRQLVDIAPVYYAPGNHEWAARYANGCDTIFDDIEATGVHWMNGTYEDAVINGKKLRIGGFFEWPRAQLERENSRAVADALNDETNALDDVCTILICHCPRCWTPRWPTKSSTLCSAATPTADRCASAGRACGLPARAFCPSTPAASTRWESRRWSSAAASAIRSRIRASSTSRNWWSWM